MTDWEMIRQEYIVGTESLKKLAVRHNVNVNAVKGRAGRGSWAKSRREYRKKMGLPDLPWMKQMPPAAPRISTAPTYAPSGEVRDRVQRIFAASDAVLDRVVLMLDTSRNLQDLRAASAALLNIKEVQMIRSALDQEEQLARFEKLQAEIRLQEREAQPKRQEPLEVVFIGRTEQASR